VTMILTILFIRAVRTRGVVPQTITVGGLFDYSADGALLEWASQQAIDAVNNRLETNLPALYATNVTLRLIPLNTNGTELG
jgi:hypothetical protein